MQPIVTVALCIATPMHIRHMQDAAKTLGVTLDTARTGKGFDLKVTATGPERRVAILRDLVDTYIAEFKASVAEGRKSFLRRMFDNVVGSVAHA